MVPTALNKSKASILGQTSVVVDSKGNLSRAYIENEEINFAADPVVQYMSKEELQKAIAQEDVKTIQNVKGIGAKTAQRLILELKDKVLKENPALPQLTLGKAQGNKVREEALQALVTLGYTKQIAEKTVDNILKTSQEELSVEQVIKKVLRGA